MEVVVPPNPNDFNFINSSSSSSSSANYANAPSTPRLMGDCYFSAPTSPERLIPQDDQLHLEFDELLIADDAHRTNSLATVPFAWEEKPGVPKAITNLFDHTDFAFDVSGEFYRDSSVSAEDLFQDGLIKPLPESTTKNRDTESSRGRQRNSSSSGNNLPSSRSRRTRSLPPFRGSELPPAPPAPTLSSCTTLSASGSGKGSKKWSFKDLFLFRSASDGRALDRDPLKKYSAIFRKHDDDFRNLSLRDRSGSGSGSKRRGRVSAHELHYTVNRAVSNDMKKKTFLPYKQGILGRLAFNPTVHALSNGFGFSHSHN